jgi:hypothetical protein
MLQNTYEIVCESKIMYGNEMWGMSEAWKESHIRFCKKLMAIQNCTPNEFAEMELGRKSRRGKCMAQIIKH